MAATASIVIDVDDSGAVAALQQINAEAAKVGPSLAPAAPQLDKIGSTAKQSREAAALLTEELGIRIPRALRNVAAESATIGPALAAAFNGVAIASFVAVGVEALGSFLEQVFAFRDAAKNAILALQKEAVDQSITMLEAAQAKEIEIRTKTAQTGANELLKLQASYLAEREQLTEAAINAEGKARITGDYAAANLANQNVLALDAEYAAEKRALLQKESDDVKIAKDQEAAASKTGQDRILADEKTALDQIDARVREGQQVWSVAQADRARVHAEAVAKITEMDRQALVDGVQAVLQAEANTLKGTAQIEKEAEAELQRITHRKDQPATDEELNAVRIERLNKLKELQIKNAEDVQKAEEDAALATLPPWERTYAQISVDTQKRLREIQQELKDTQITADDAARLSAAAWQENFAKTRDQLANDLQSFFDDITSGNIGQRFRKLFEQLVFQMVATWILGMNQMRAASAVGFGGGGGGILGAIFGGLGGIFGGGGGGIASIPGVITNFGESGLDNLPTSLGSGTLGALGLSAGQGSTGLGTVLPAGSAPGGILGSGGGLGALLGGGPAGAALLGALGLFNVAGKAGPIGGAAIGAVGGALGTGALIAAFPALLGVLGAATLGIGAAVGAVVGLLFGIGGSTRKARLQIEAQVKQQAQQIEDNYDTFQTDYSSAHDQLEQLRQQGVDALRKAGVKDINRSRVGHVDQWVNKAEKEIDATQADRTARGALVFGPPQFHRGGFVDGGLATLIPAAFRAGASSFHSGGEVPAVLEAGEFVFQKPAVQRIGRGNLERMNSSGSVGDTYNIQIHAIDAKSFDEFLRQGGARKIVSALRRGRIEGAW